MNKILLEITGTQQVDFQKDKIELTTVGTLRDDGRAYIIRYNEEQAPPYSPIKVTLRIYKDESAVELTRSGQSNSCLLIEKSKRNLCQYGTPYGNILMGIYGKQIKADVNECGGSFNFGYDIDINGSVTSSNAVNMTFTIKQ